MFDPMVSSWPSTNVSGTRTGFWRGRSRSWSDPHASSVHAVRIWRPWTTCPATSAGPSSSSATSTVSTSATATSYSGPRDRRRRGTPRRRGHVRSAPDRGPPARHAPLTLTDIDRRSDCSPRPGSTTCFVVAFTRALATWSPRSSSTGCSSTGCRPRRWWSGRTSASGRRLLVTWRMLTEAGGRATSGSTGIPLDGGPQIWSSTYVRTAWAVATSRAPPRRSGGRSR